MYKLLLKIFIFFTFFPYLQIIAIPGTGDTQPFSAFFASLVCLMYILEKKIFFIKNIFLYCFSLLPLAIIFFLSSKFDIQYIIRSLTGYASLFFIGFASYIYLKDNNGISNKFIKTVILIWFIVGAIQVFIWPEFMTFFLPRASTSTSRGVIGLAPEPSYYATILIFLFFYSIFKLESKIYILLVIIQIVLFARSSLAVLLFGLFFLVYLIVKRKYIILGIGLASMYLLSQIILSIDINTRMIELMKKIANNGVYLVFKTDGSLNDRLGSIYFSLKGFLDHYGFPAIFENYSQYVEREQYKQEFFSVFSMNRILSGYGSVLFELGIFGLIIPIIFVIAIFKYFKSQKEWQIIISICFTSFMFTPVPISLPYVAFFLAFLLYSKNSEPCFKRKPSKIQRWFLKVA
jgi:hypothetical protein